MIFIALLFLAGLFLIIKGGDVFVDRAVWIAEVFNIPKFIIGATIVSIATTLPELLVSVIATVSGECDIAVGNAVGSVTANTAMIMAIGIIFLCRTVRTDGFRFGMICLTASALILTLICKNGRVSPIGGALSLCVCIAFMVYNIHTSKSQELSQRDRILPAIPVVKPPVNQLTANAVIFALSAAAIAIGAKLLVFSGTRIAEGLGVSDRIIGLTIIAVGTSLPELVTTVTAIVKREGGLSIGNIVGANIIDLSLIMPICSFISMAKFGTPLTFEPRYEYIDIPVCLGFVLIACVPTLIKKRFTRLQGVIMLLLYIAYMLISVKTA